MKKKFVLTLALVLMVAVTLTAATPVEVSGTFKAGYDFKFASKATTITQTGGQASYATLLNFTGDFWKVTLGDDAGNLFTSEDAAKVAAKAEIYLDKALAAEGVDMGDVTATLHVGTGVGKGAPNVFADTYDGWKKNVAMSGSNNFGVTIGYAALGSLYVAYDPVAGDSFVVGGKVTPVDGVGVAFGFTTDQGGENALGASVAADIAKLADLDFALNASAEYHALLAKTAKHHIAAEVSGSYEGIGLWVEYKTDDLEVHALAAKASYSTTIEGVSLGAGLKFEVLDFSDFENKYNVIADASAGYTMGGVAYKLAAKYDVSGKAFTLSPSVTIKF